MVEESSPPRCDPRFMGHQPPQRRYWRWFWLLVVLMMLVAVPVVLGAHHRQQGVEGQCAVQFAGDKSALAGYHWSWWWLPGWVCEFEREGEGGSGVSGRRHNTSRSMASVKSTPKAL